MLFIDGGFLKEFMHTVQKFSMEVSLISYLCDLKVKGSTEISTLFTPAVMNIYMMINDYLPRYFTFQSIALFSLFLVEICFISSRLTNSFGPLEGIKLKI